MPTLAPPRACEICGREFQPTVKQVKRGYGKTCSPECRCTKWYRAVTPEGRRRGQLKRDPNSYQRGPLANNYQHGGYVNNIEAPHILRAHNAVRHALKRGELTKQPCAMCGTTERIEAHHDDYAKLLDVRWLCFPCHRAFHIAQRGDRTCQTVSP